MRAPLPHAEVRGVFVVSAIQHREHNIVVGHVSSFSECRVCNRLRRFVISCEHERMASEKPAGDALRN